MAAIVTRLRPRTKRVAKEPKSKETANNPDTPDFIIGKLQENYQNRTNLVEPEDFISEIFIHPSAEVAASAEIGAGSRVWQQAQIRDRAVLGQQCTVGKGTYIDQDVVIGDYVNIHNMASIYRGAIIEGGVSIGPGVCFTNERYPRAVTSEGRPRKATEGDLECTYVRYGATIGAGAIILPGLIVGSFAMIGAGAVVTQDVPDQQMVVGNPARPKGYVCRCGRLLKLNRTTVSWSCGYCHETYVFKI